MYLFIMFYIHVGYRNILHYIFLNTFDENKIIELKLKLFLFIKQITNRVDEKLFTNTILKGWENNPLKMFSLFFFFIKLLIFQQNIENRKHNIKEKHVEN